MYWDQLFNTKLFLPIWFRKLRTVIRKDVEKGNKEKTSDHSDRWVWSLISRSHNKIYERKGMVTHPSYYTEYENYNTLKKIILKLRFN